MRLTKLAIFVVAIFSSSFAFAQTPSTTVAEQPAQTGDALQQQINQIAESRTSQLSAIIENMQANAIRDYLEVKTVPQNPNPDETVRVSIESYLSDLNKAMIVWSVDGKTVSQGIGKKTFSFQNGHSGKTTRLTIYITTNAGDVVVKELSWNPIGVTILWEADTYVPPFYKGKALPTAQANVRAVALPNNTAGQNALAAGNFVYVWEKDGTVVSDASGYAKNFFTFAAPKPYGDAYVKVRVSSTNDAIKSETRVDIPIFQPFILFYEKHPLLGVWYNRPFGTDITLNRREFSMSAEPFFFSNERSDAPTLKYDWSTNGNAVQNYGHTITLRNDIGGKGDSSISLAMRNFRQTFQSANQALMVHFTEDIGTRPTF